MVVDRSLLTMNSFPLAIIAIGPQVEAMVASLRMDFELSEDRVPVDNRI